VKDVRLDSIFVCRVCGSALVLDEGGRSGRCSSCGQGAPFVSGVLDFGRGQQGEAEQAHYEAIYADSPPEAVADARSAWESAWQSLYYPMNRAVLQRVGDIQGRTVVLLGNGTSEKEFFFLAQDPELLVFSDLSLTAVRAVRDRCFPQGRPNLVFAAMDALDLPLADESVDLIYGYAFVHHLPDVDAFLGDAARVLRAGGHCVFMDDAYSALWQGAKLTVLRPLMRYFHRLQEPSPEDLRFTLAGGFREERLARRIRELGCEPWFERSGFVHYLVTRASERLPPQRSWRALVRSNVVLRSLIQIDDWPARVPGMYHNQIRLVWGFEKPTPLARSRADR
jgi:SAM-dependent methyltransferase